MGVTATTYYTPGEGATAPTEVGGTDRVGHVGQQRENHGRLGMIGMNLTARGHQQVPQGGSGCGVWWLAGRARATGAGCGAEKKREWPTQGRNQVGPTTKENGPAVFSSFSFLYSFLISNFPLSIQFKFNSCFELPCFKIKSKVNITSTIFNYYYLLFFLLVIYLGEE
jgi:hypothetical protein